jgi:hypothetical protein
MSQRCEEEISNFFAKDAWDISSDMRIDSRSLPRVSARPADSSKNFIVGLFFLVVMLRYLLDRHKLNLADALNDVERPIGTAQSNGPLTDTISLERLIVKTRNLTNFI